MPTRSWLRAFAILLTLAGLRVASAGEPAVVTVITRHGNDLTLRNLSDAPLDDGLVLCNSGIPEVRATCRISVFHRDGELLATVIEEPKPGAIVKGQLFYFQVNTAPTLKAKAWPLSCSSGAIVAFDAEGSDADRDSLTYTWEAGEGLFFSRSTTHGRNYWRAPYANRPTKIAFSVTVADPMGAQEHITAAVDVRPAGAFADLERSAVINVSGSMLPNASAIRDFAPIQSDRTMLLFEDNPRLVALHHPVLETYAGADARGRLAAVAGPLAEGSYAVLPDNLEELLVFGSDDHLTAAIPLLGTGRRGGTQRVDLAALGPDTVAVLDTARKLIDVYRLESDRALPLFTRYLTDTEGTPIKVRRAGETLLCALTDANKLYLVDLTTQTTRPIALDLPEEARITSMDADLAGRLLLLDGVNGVLYQGDIFSPAMKALPLAIPFTGPATRYREAAWMSGIVGLITKDPNGLVLLDPETETSRILGDLGKRDVRRLACLPDGGVTAYDRQQHALLTFDPWGFLLYETGMPMQMQVDQMAADEEGSVLLLDREQDRVLKLPGGMQGEPHPMAVRMYRPEAVAACGQDVMVVSAKTRDLAFSRNRVMGVIVRDGREATPQRFVSPWPAPHFFRPDYYRAALSTNFAVIANNNLRQLMVQRRDDLDNNRAQTIGSYAALGIEKVQAMAMDTREWIYILAAQPPGRLVVVSPTDLSIIGEDRAANRLDGDKITSFAVDPSGNAVFLDRGHKQILWYRPAE